MHSAFFCSQCLFALRAFRSGSATISARKTNADEGYSRQELVAELPFPENLLIQSSRCHSGLPLRKGQFSPFLAALDSGTVCGMWKLSGRDNKIRQWADLGEFESVSAAARRVLELEGDALGAVFFRVYVDPINEQSDADILCRLEYQSEKGFYLLQRVVQ